MIELSNEIEKIITYFENKYEKEKAQLSREEQDNYKEMLEILNKARVSEFNYELKHLNIDIVRELIMEYKTSDYQLKPIERILEEIAEYAANKAKLIGDSPGKREMLYKSILKNGYTDTAQISVIIKRDKFMRLYCDCCELTSFVRKKENRKPEISIKFEKNNTIRFKERMYI